MKHILINQRTTELTKREELAVLDAKHVSKTRYERLKPLASLTWWFCNLFQFNSFSLAALGGCAYLWFDMGSKGVPFMILVVAFFAAVELVVHKALKTYGAMKYDDKVVSPIIYVFIFLSLGASTPSTLFLTHYSIQLVTPSPVLIDTSDIVNKHDILISKDTSYWNNREDKARQEAAEYKGLATRTNSKTGVTKLRSRSTKTYNNLLSNIDSMTVKKDIALHRGRDNKERAINAALVENQARIDNYISWCSEFGWLLAGVSALSILLLLPFRLFYEYWERLYAKDLRVSVQMEEETETDTSTDKKDTRINVTDTDKKTTRTVINAFATANTSLNRTCMSCGTDITNKRKDAKFCSSKCRTTHHKTKIK